MKSILLSVAVLLLTITLSNCKKDSDRYIVKGRFVNSCDDTKPLAYVDMYVEQLG